MRLLRMPVRPPPPKKGPTSALGGRELLRREGQALDRPKEEKSKGGRRSVFVKIPAAKVRRACWGKSVSRKLERRKGPRGTAEKGRAWEEIIMRERTWSRFGDHHDESRNRARSSVGGGKGLSDRNRSHHPTERGINKEERPE